MKYTYNIEDGQFSREIIKNKLLGNSGDTIELDDEGEMVQAYILFIDEDYVQCLGNIGGSFPKNFQEHNRMLNLLKPEKDSEYTITYMDSNNEIVDSPMVIIASSKEEAVKIFKTDNPYCEIYKIE